MYVRPVITWNVEQALGVFFFGIEESVLARLVPGESEH
jgi:hypothetical protein